MRPRLPRKSIHEEKHCQSSEKLSALFQSDSSDNGHYSDLIPFLLAHLLHVGGCFFFTLIPVRNRGLEQPCWVILSSFLQSHAVRMCNLSAVDCAPPSGR